MMPENEPWENEQFRQVEQKAYQRGYEDGRKAAFAQPVATMGDGIEAAAKLIDKRREDYEREHGHYDPDTGFTEYPGDGACYVQELEEIAEEIRSLRAAQPDKPVTAAVEWTDGEGLALPDKILSEDDQLAIDQALENHKARLPVAKMKNNNMEGRLCLIEMEPSCTIEVGQPLYAGPKVVEIPSRRLEEQLKLARDIGRELGYRAAIEERAAQPDEARELLILRVMDFMLNPKTWRCIKALRRDRRSAAFLAAEAEKKRS